MIGLYLVHVGEGLLKKTGENGIFQLQNHVLVQEYHKYVCRKRFGDNFKYKTARDDLIDDYNQYSKTNTRLAGRNSHASG